jgi:FkbM family methyltransferase
MNTEILVPIAFFTGCTLSSISIYIYLRIRKRNKLPYIFDLTDYSSQQLAKLLANNIMENNKKKINLQSIDSRLPLEFQSQWCEDVLLFDYFKRKKNGFFIEIGAFDGIKLSNTYFFESIGWKGILVEPQPNQYDKLIVNRPNSKCYNVGIGMDSSDLELNIVQDADYETWSYVSNKENKEKNIPFKTQKIKVKSVKLNDIIPSEITKIDFISIDVEGMELDILKTIDWDKYFIEVVLLENNTPPIQKFLARHGYHLVYRTWINYFYSKNELGFKNISVWENLDITIVG